MRHRFHVPLPLAEGATIPLQGDELHHATRVVRVHVGEEVELFDGSGATFSGIVETATRDETRVRVVKRIESHRESPLALTLAMSIIQLEKFELVLQKATELGVQRIIPLVTDRIEVRAERYRGKAERWERIIFEAVKQSGRAVVPQLETPADFAKAIEREGAIVLFDADIEPTTMPTTLSSATIFIGPEGGWSEEELSLARDRKAIFQRLGPRRLRAETAAIVAAAILTARFGDI